MCEVDASRAIQKLGLKQPVVFEFVSLSQDRAGEPADPVVSAFAHEPLTAGRTRPSADDVHHIQVDLDAIKFANKEPLQHVIAHELWHCHQFEAMGDYLHASIEVMYDHTMTGTSYAEDPLEREANEHADELAKLITVTGCESRYPVTFDEMQAVADEMLPKLQVKYPRTQPRSISDMLSRIANGDFPDA